ncbi:MAG: restriction endonuclease subunit S [bacterium]
MIAITNPERVRQKMEPSTPMQKYGVEIDERPVSNLPSLRGTPLGVPTKCIVLFPGRLKKHALGCGVKRIRRKSSAYPSNSHGVSKASWPTSAQIDQMAAQVEEALARLQEYRTALITAAVTGKIEVRRASSEGRFAH